MNAVLPDWLFKTTWIYHITSIDNLDSILSEGKIYSTNSITCSKCSIANKEIQSRRATKTVDIEPYGVIHDYVPFYFAPRSPMLYVNHKGSIENARKQEDIVHIVSTAQIVANSNAKFVFTDRHAIKAYA